MLVMIRMIGMIGMMNSVDLLSGFGCFAGPFLLTKMARSGRIYKGLRRCVACYCWQRGQGKISILQI